MKYKNKSWNILLTSDYDDDAAFDGVARGDDKMKIIMVIIVTRMMMMMLR